MSYISGWATEQTDEMVGWLYRDFESYENWKARGREIFLQVDGSSDGARKTLASDLCKYACGEKRKLVNVRNWREDLSEIVVHRVKPPDVSTSNCKEIEWLEIADYILLAASGGWEGIQIDNQRRSAENRKRVKKNLPPLPMVEPYRSVKFA